MPEFSQDNFEALNPVKSQITPEFLRARANSIGNTSSSSGSGTGAVRKQKKVSISGLPPISPDEEFRGRAYTASDMDNSVINGVGEDHYKGYKREIDHRYGISRSDEITKSMTKHSTLFGMQMHSLFIEEVGKQNRLTSSLIMF